MGFVPRGIIPPIITPLTDDGEVNYPVLRQMVNHLIDNGVHGLFPLGTTGEFYAFDDDTYRKILETVKDVVFRFTAVQTISQQEALSVW